MWKERRTRITEKMSRNDKRNCQSLQEKRHIKTARVSGKIESHQRGLRQSQTVMEGQLVAGIKDLVQRRVEYLNVERGRRG